MKSLIQTAYVTFADGHLSLLPQTVSIEGGPAWINSDRYQISAKAEGTPSEAMIGGSMMRALLEDRFKLKIHRESKEMAVYALTVAKGGPKLQPFKEGSCWKPLGDAEVRSGPPPGLQMCRMPVPESKGPNVTLDAQGMGLFEFSVWFGLDRRVIDKTGLVGLFNLHLEFAPDQSTPGMGPLLDPLAAPLDPTGGTSIFTAIQEQLGLKLEPAKGPGEFLVIDSVERPSEN